MHNLITAQSDEHWLAARKLISEYADSLDFDLDFQDFDTEMASMPEQYGPPRGCFILAEHDGRYVGCVGVRHSDPGICEMKRLWVQPRQRHSGLGRQLAVASIEAARMLGYQRMRLDTVPEMKAARALYLSLGFVDIPPYRHNPIACTAFMELQL